MTQNRLQYIDIAKGMGILLVVLGHVRTSAPLHDTIYLFHMPLFFLLSGMLFKLEEGWWLCMRKKFVHLLLPYLFFMAMFVPLRMATDAFCTGEFPAFRLSMLGLSYFDKPLWFVFALFGVIAIMRTLFSFLRNRYAVSAIVVALSIVGYFLFLRKIELPFHVSRALFVLPFFALGIILRAVGNKIRWFAAVGIVLFSLGLWGLSQGHTVLDTLKLQVDSNPLFVYLPAVGGSLVVLTLSLLCAEDLLTKVKIGGVNGYAYVFPILDATPSTYLRRIPRSSCSPTASSTDSLSSPVSRPYMRLC